MLSILKNRRAAIKLDRNIEVKPVRVEGFGEGFAGQRASACEGQDYDYLVRDCVCLVIYSRIYKIEPFSSIMKLIRYCL